jgi:hypothetical protein
MSVWIISLKGGSESLLIKIMGREAFFVPYTLGKTVAFSMLKEPIGYLLWVIFCDFFFLTFFLYVGKIMSYKKAVRNARYAK